jgi:predicted NUDIX family NTP pyrophosphohydrolase
MAARSTSAGLLVFRRRPEGVEILLAHPGGPFWSKRDAGAWTVIKGELDDGEQPLAAARREFTEETGLPVPEGPTLPLGSVMQRGGKVVEAWAVEGEVDPAELAPGTFIMEWPPRSGRTAEFPEVDRVAWFDPATARAKLNPAQVPFVDRLLESITD